MLLKSLKRSRLASSAVALVLAFSVLFSTFGGLSIFAGQTSDVWGGEVATAFASGTGSQDDPYVIATGGQLRLMVEQGSQTAGKYYKLANDIYLNDVSTQNWYEGANLNQWNTVAVADDTKAFKGHLNGAGHKVFGLYTKTTTTWTDDAHRDTSVAAGLLPLVGGGASVDAVGVEDAYISITNASTNASAKQAGFAGALIGAFRGNSDSAPISVTRSYAADTVHLIAAFVGFIGGGESLGGQGVTVSNCYSLLSWETHTVEDTNNRAGLIGRQPGGATFSGCFAIGNVAGTIVNKGAVDNYVTGWTSGAATNVAESSIYSGAAAKDAMPALDWENTFMTTASHPILRTFYVDTTVDVGDIWSGSTNGGEIQGAGTVGNPFRIENAEQFAWAIANGGNNAYYVLTKDLYFNDVTRVNWATGEVNGDYEPNTWYGSYNMDGTSYGNNKVFKGTIDGAGNTIYGIYYTPGDPNAAAGLIPVANGATVKNLRVAKSFIAGGRWTGALIGHGTSVTVDKVVIDSTVTIHAYNSGNKYITQTQIDRATAGQDGWPFFYSNTGASFQSTGVSGIVGYANSAATISNVAVYAKFKTEDFNYTTTNALTNGGNPVRVSNGSHLGGLIGACWNTAITVSDSISNVRPFDGANGSGAVNFTDVYAFTNDKNIAGVTVVNDTSITGNMAENTLGGLDFATTWATTTEFPTLKIFNKMSADEYWSGAEVAPTEGAGTVDDPILIKTPEELAYIIKNGMDGKHYRLENDLYLNDITQIDFTTGAVNSGYIAKQWYTYANDGVLNGTFDGNAHKIYGLYYKNTGANTWALNGAGLFPSASDGLTVKNLGVDCAYVKHPSAAGIVIGGISGAMAVVVDQVYVGANATADGNDAGAIIGANTGDLTMSNCYSLATTIAVSRSGLIGESYTYGGHGNATSSITNCYNAKGKIANGSMSLGWSNLYATVAQDDVTVLTAQQMQGLTVMDEGNAMAGLGDKFQATTTYPMLSIFAPVKPAPEAGVWDGTTKTAPTEGTGTAADPFIIHNAAELYYVVNAGEATAGKFYKLANDIFINEIDKADWTTGDAIGEAKLNVWAVEGSFRGTLDGNGHTVFGLYYKNTAQKKADNSGYGLIKTIVGETTIKNLGVDYAYVESATGASAFVAVNTTANSHLKIEYCYVGANVTISGYASGAFIAVSDKQFTLDHVYNLGTLKVNTHKWNHWQTGIPEDRAGIAGIYGDNWGDGSNKSVLTNAYSANGPVSTGNKISTVNNVFTVVDGDKSGAIYVPAAEMQGLDAFNLGKKLQALNIDKAWEVTDTYPILDVFAETSGNDGEEYVPESDVDENGIWKGIVQETFSDKSAGTANDPIILATPGELALAISSGGAGKYYKLADDMYLNDVSTKRWFTNTNNNGWFSDATTFNGHIDGAGHIVYGLWYPSSQKGAVGLVPKMGNGSIKNLGIRYSYIRSTQNLGAGAFIGYAQNVIDIEQCFADDSVQVSSTTAGGIVGLAQQNSAASTKGLVIRNCYSKVVINSDGGGKANGLIGNPWITAYEIYDSYSIGMKPYYTGGSGGFRSSIFWYQTMKFDAELNTWVTDKSEAKEGVNAADYFKDIYTDKGDPDTTDHFWTKLSKSNMYGHAAKNYMTGLDFENVWVTTEEGSPILKIFAGKVTGEDIDLSADSEVFSKGKGTEKNPYLIENAEQLAYLVQSENTKGKYYKLANDIYINDTTKKNWTTNAKTWFADLSSAAFAGHLEGDGHSIHGIYINQTPTPEEQVSGNYVGGTGAGLFSYIHSDAVVRNLHIRDSYISGRGCVGAIAGHTTGTAGERAEILGCSVDESVTLRGYSVGGIVGAGVNVGVEIYFSYVLADIGGTGTSDRMNSFIGDIWGCPNDIMECYGQGLRFMRGNSGVMYNNYSDTYSASVTVVPNASMYGTAAKAAMAKLSWDRVWVTVKGKTPQQKVIPEGTYPFATDEGKKGRVWSGNVATKFAGGKGTEAEPYLIETPEQMAFLINKGGQKGTYYKLTADLKLNDTSKPNWTENANMWFTGKTFSGHFDGAGHVVSGLYYNLTDGNYCGLFPQLNGSSTIKRVGVINSYLANYAVETSHTYAGGIVGFVANWDGYMGASLSADGITSIYGEIAPVISECFVDHTVELEGDTVGGIIGGSACGWEVYNCYATCTLTGTYSAAGIFGDNWESNEGVCIVLNSYSATADRDPGGRGPKYSESKSVFDSFYVDGSTQSTNATRLSLYYMQSERAREFMPEFDYNKTWKIVIGGTPVLRCFKNAEQYSCGRQPAKVTVTFVTGDGGSQHEPIAGIPLIDKIDVSTFPVPTRYGYEFVQWHLYDTYDLPFHLTTFPNYNCFAYAEWAPVGFTQGWEGSNSVEYDINTAAEFYQPGVAGYNPKYIRGGLRSLKAKADAEVQPMFLLSYETKVEVGKEYDINFWMTAKEDGASGKIEVFHSNYADVNDTVIGYQTGLEFKDLKGGEWKQYQIKVVANGPYLIFRTPLNCELYFDDVQVVPTGNEGELGNLEGFNPGEINSEPGEEQENNDMTIVWIIVGIAGGVIVLGGAAVVTVVLVNKGKAGKKKEETPTDAE